MRGDSPYTLNKAEAWEESQDDDTVVSSGCAPVDDQTVADGQTVVDDIVTTPREEGDADLPLDTVNWTRALASMEIPNSQQFGAWIDAISGAGQPGPNDHEVAELFSEDDSQIGFDSDEQVVL